MKTIDMVGKKLNRLFIFAGAGVNNRGEKIWRCLCDCGNEVVVPGYDLRTGHTKSCGCLNAEHIERGIRYKHGFRGTTEFNIWANMRQRCSNRNNPRWESYGGRGITVCDRWEKSFQNFIDDMGRRPSPKHSLDRIDNNLGYSKENCRWATPEQQGNNTRFNNRIEFNGQTKTLSEWARELGISHKTLTTRWHRGWAVPQLFSPVKKPKG